MCGSSEVSAVVQLGRPASGGVDQRQQPAGPQEPVEDNFVYGFRRHLHDEAAATMVLEHAYIDRMRKRWREVSSFSWIR